MNNPSTAASSYLQPRCLFCGLPVPRLRQTCEDPAACLIRQDAHARWAWADHPIPPSPFESLGRPAPSIECSFSPEPAGRAGDEGAEMMTERSIQTMTSGELWERFVGRSVDEVRARYSDLSSGPDGMTDCEIAEDLTRAATAAMREIVGSSNLYESEVEYVRAGLLARLTA